MENIIISVIWFFFFVTGLIGVYILLKSPSVLKMDKKMNRCTKETKYIWQKEYRIENLCKLSEVKKAIIVQRIFSPIDMLYLELQSGKTISCFFDPCKYYEYTPCISKKKDRINRFLKENDKECEISHSLYELGYANVAPLFSVLLVLLLIYYFG